MKKISLQKMMIVGILSAMSIVLSYLSIPLLPSNSYLKFDPSDIPAIIVAFIVGVGPAILVCVIKNLVSLISSSTAGIGELINLLIGITLVLSIYYPFNKLQNKISKTKTYITTIIICVFSTVIVGALLNFALTPVFNLIFGYPNNIEVILIRVFEATILNIIKPILTFGVSILILKSIFKTNTNI